MTKMATKRRPSLNCSKGGIASGGAHSGPPTHIDHLGNHIAVSGRTNGMSFAVLLVDFAHCADDPCEVEKRVEVNPGALDASTWGGDFRGGAFSLSVLRIQNAGDGGRNGFMPGVLVGR
jgi:hypothetical protein